MVKALIKMSRKEVEEVNISYIGHLSVSLLGKTLLVFPHLHQVKYRQFSKKKLVVVCLKRIGINTGTPCCW